MDYSTFWNWFLQAGEPCTFMTLVLNIPVPGLPKMIINTAMNILAPGLAKDFIKSKQCFRKSRNVPTPFAITAIPFFVC